MFVNKRQFRFVHSRTNLPLIAFIVVCFLAFIGGQIQWFRFAHTAPLTAQLAGLGLFVISMAAFVLIANQIKDILWLKRLTWVFLALGGFYLFSRLLPQGGWTPRVFFQYGSDASMFWIWVVVLSASQALFNRTLALRWRILLGGLCASAFYVSFAQAYDWKSGWLPALVGLFVVVWLGFPRFRLPLILVGLVVGALELLLPQPAVLGGEDYSMLTRMEAYRIILEIVKVNPFLGFGPANYYYYTPLFPILGYSVSFNSHNNYIDILAQIGLLGLLCFLWFFWELTMTGWRLLPKAPEGFEKAFVIGVLGGIAGTLFTGMLGDWIIPFVYNVGMAGFRSSIYGWLFMGGLVALEEILRRSNAQAA
jgi:O-antigen ligase